MATVNAGMTISLDGYVADRSGIPTAPRRRIARRCDAGGVGDGIRLLDNLDPERVQLEKMGVQEWGRAPAFGSASQGSLGRVGEPTNGSQNRLSQAIDLVELCDGRIEDELVNSDVLELRCDVLYRIG
jgi:hypothetical protein